MARGRKSNSQTLVLDSEQLFDKNVGVYFELILGFLGKLEIFGQDTIDNLLNDITFDQKKAGFTIKKLAKISKSDIPFELPRNWKWCRLGEITNYGSSKKSIPSNLSPDTWVLDLEDIEKTSSKLLAKVRFSERNSLSSKSVFKSGDLLYSKLRPYLDKVIVADEDGVCTTEILPLKCFGGINSEYFKYALKTRYFLKYVNSVTKGMKMPRLGTKEGKLALFPLAPLIEQEKIVKFLNDFGRGTICDDHEYFDKDIESKIKTLHSSQLLTYKLFGEQDYQLSQIKLLNESILNDAIKGKLVPQDSTEESVDDLLANIREMVSKPSRSKTTNFQKNKFPFEIPSTWRWCKLNEIFIKIGSGSTPKGGDYSSEGYVFFRSQNIHNDGLNLEDVKYISPNTHRKMRGTTVFKRDILLNITGGSLGRCSLVPSAFGEGNVSQHVAILRPIFMNNEYLHKVILSPYFQNLIFSSTTGAGREGLPKYNLENFLIPIPPVKEQQRIVNQINRDFHKTMLIRDNITNDRSETLSLLDALLNVDINQLSSKRSIAINGGNEVSDALSKVDYFRLRLLATEIVWQLHLEPTFGHLKLQKLIYLCQKSASINLPTNFLKQAMGPYDPKLMRYLDSELYENEWFEYNQAGVLKYKPLKYAGNHKADFNKYFNYEQAKIQFLIDSFRSLKSEVIEIVATLFSCLEQIREEKSIFSEALLFKRFYEWSDEKGKFNEAQIKKVFKRMVETGIYPKNSKPNE